MNQDMIIGIAVGALVMLCLAVVAWRQARAKQEVHRVQTWSDRYDAHEELHGNVHRGAKSGPGLAEPDSDGAFHERYYTEGNYRPVHRSELLGEHGLDQERGERPHHQLRRDLGETVDDHVGHGCDLDPQFDEPEFGGADNFGELNEADESWGDRLDKGSLIVSPEEYERRQALPEERQDHLEIGREPPETGHPKTSWPEPGAEEKY